MSEYFEYLRKPHDEFISPNSGAYANGENEKPSYIYWDAQPQNKPER